MTHFIDHRRVDPALIREVVEFVEAQGKDTSGLDVIAAFEPKGHDRVYIQRAMQEALDTGRLHLTIQMKLGFGNGGRPGWA